MEYKNPPNVTYTPPSQPANTSTSMIPSLVSGGASILGGAIDAISNAINHKRDLQAQKEENQKNREHAEMMYKKYESPQAQAQQLAAAGLNPAAQGAVSTQSVGSASTSSLPTSSPSTFGSSIAEGAMNAVNSYSQRKQFQQQLDADALNQTRNFFLELSRLDLDRQELQVQLDLWREQIAASKVSREYQEKINKELQQFLDAGHNRLIDTHDQVRQAISKIDHDMQYDQKRFNLEISKYNLDKQVTQQNLQALIRDNDFAESVKQLYGLDYSSLPDYLKTMVTGIVLARRKLHSFNFDTVGDYKEYRERLEQLESDFGTYYSDYLKNSADATALSAGGLSDRDILSNIIALLK